MSAVFPAASMGHAPLSSRVAFFLTTAFVAIAYLRPQDWIGGLSRAPVAIAVALPLAVCLAIWARPAEARKLDVAALALTTLFAAIWVPFATNGFHAFESFKFLALEMLGVIAIGSFVDSAARLRTLLVVFLGSLGAQAAFALGHQGRGFTSYFGDENDLALGMNMALPFAVFGAFSARRGWVRLSLLGLSALYVAAVIVSGSRGGLVALVATSGAMLVLSRRRLLTISTLVVGVGFLAVLVPQTYWEEMKTIADGSDPTRNERLRQWSLSTDIWADNPVFGVGPGNVPWVVTQYESYDTQVTRSMAGRAVHSLYFTILAELGLCGVALYGGLITGLLTRCRTLGRVTNRLEVDSSAFGRAIACSIVAWLTGGLFLSVLYYSQFYCVVGIALAVSEIHRRSAGASEAVSVAPRSWAKPLEPITP